MGRADRLVRRALPELGDESLWASVAGTRRARFLGREVQRACVLLVTERTLWCVPARGGPSVSVPLGALRRVEQHGDVVTFDTDEESIVVEQITDRRELDNLLALLDPVHAPSPATGHGHVLVHAGSA